MIYITSAWLSSIKDYSFTAGKMSQEDQGWDVSTHITDKVPSAPVTPALGSRRDSVTEINVVW